MAEDLEENSNDGNEEEMELLRNPDASISANMKKEDNLRKKEEVNDIYQLLKA
jgi:hypothetical protein